MAAGAGEPRILRSARLIAGAVRTALRVLEGPNVRLRAMALTYLSLFALVPALLVVFSVVQAFTGMDRIVTPVHEFLFENLAVGARETVQPYLAQFVTNAHATSAGLVGAAILAWSAVTLFANVEDAFNDIWGVRRRRSLTQQAVTYWVGLTLGPLLLAGSLTLAGTARGLLADTGIKALAALAGAVLTCTFFTVLYVIVPFTKVQLRAALVGGVAAGLIWELAKWGYALGVGRIFSYHAIYGSVAAVPIFIFWLFVSWAIVLFGARLAFVVQYAPALLQRRPQQSSRSGREILAGHAMLSVARAFDRGATPPDAGMVATTLRATADEAAEVLGTLRQAGLLVSLGGGGLVPSRPLEKITLLDIRRAVLGRDPVEVPNAGTLEGILSETEARASERLAAVHFRALCEAERTKAHLGAPAPGSADAPQARAAPTA